MYGKYCSIRSFHLSAISSMSKKKLSDEWSTGQTERNTQHTIGNNKRGPSPKHHGYLVTPEVCMRSTGRQSRLLKSVRADTIRLGWKHQTTVVPLLRWDTSGIYKNIALLLPLVGTRSACATTKGFQFAAAVWADEPRILEQFSQNPMSTDLRVSGHFNQGRAKYLLFPAMVTTSKMFKKPQRSAAERFSHAAKRP